MRISNREVTGLELCEVGESTRLLAAKKEDQKKEDLFDTYISMAEKLTALPECEDHYGRLFYLATFGTADNKLPLTSKDVTLMQAKTTPQPTVWQEQSRPIIITSCLTSAITGTLGLKLLDTSYKLLGVVALVVALASASFGFIAYKKGAYETLSEIRQQNQKRYRNIAECLVRLKQDNLSTARKLALRLDIEAIQTALTPITDEQYSATLCSYLRQAKEQALSN
jgi:hypothetical protein